MQPVLFQEDRGTPPAGFLPGELEFYYLAALVIPESAMPGLTRMRIIMGYRWDKACGDFMYGEAEDYTVLLTDGADTASAPQGRRKL